MLHDRVQELTGIQVPVASMYDIQIKRIHEYKRQHLVIPLPCHPSESRTPQSLRFAACVGPRRPADPHS